MYKLRWVFAIATLAVVFVFGSAGESYRLAWAAEPAPAAAEIKIDNFSFSPATLTVKAGTQITWTNRDDIPHTVTSDEGLFKSKVLDTDDSFTFRPAKPGTYSYYCSIHPKMMGKGGV